MLGEVIFFGQQLRALERGHARLYNYETFEVQHTLDVTQCHVQHHAQTGWQGFQKPDVRNRRRKIDVAHALTTHFGQSHFNATLLADHTAMLQTLVLAAQAFVVLDWAKNFGTKQTITLGLEGAVVDGFWLFNFTERPRTDFVGRCDRNLDCVELLVLLDLFKQI